MKRILLLLMIISALYAPGSALGSALDDFASHIKSEVAEINSLAEKKELKSAIGRLNDLNRYIEHQVNFELEDQLSRAKRENPSFKLNLDLRLRPELTSAYWQDRHERAQRAYRNAREAMSGLASMRTLDKQDTAWAYLKTTYDAVKTIKDVVESVGTQEYWDAFKSAKEGVDDFIENYVNIEEAHLQGLKTDLMEAQMKQLQSRAKKTIAAVEPALSYMKANAEEGDRFTSLLRRVKKTGDDLDSGKTGKLAFGDSRYTWNYEPFKKELEKACQEFGETGVKCPDFKKSFEEIRQRARTDWKQVSGNIKSSGDKEQKPKFLEWHNEAWSDFTRVVSSIFTKVYNESCKAAPSRPAEVARDPSPADQKAQAFAGIEQKEEPREAEPAAVEKQAPASAVPRPLPEKSTRPKTDPHPPSTTAVSPTRSSDKYWENSIPAQAEKDWMYDMAYFVRYRVAGRTVGFRRYEDPQLRYPLNEDAMDNLAIKHGPSRRFAFDIKTGTARTTYLTFFRNDKQTGPAAAYNMDGTVGSVQFYIDGVALSEAEYRQKAGSDKSLAPADLYKEEKWREIPQENVPPDLAAIACKEEIPWRQFNIPADAVKFVEASYSKEPQGIFYYEHYFHPEIHGEIGERMWFIPAGSPPILEKETIQRGGRKINRAWDRSTGELSLFELRQARKEGGGFSSIYNSVGPRLSNKLTSYYCADQKECTADEYRKQRSAHPDWPEAEILGIIPKTRPGVAPDSHPDPQGIGSDIGSMRVPAGAQIWSISFGRESTSVDYVLDHRKVASLGWHDKEMKNPSSRTIYSFGHRVLSAGWFTSGKPSWATVQGRTYKDGVDARFDENGKVVKYSYHRKTGVGIESGKLAYQNLRNIPAENAHLSGLLKQDMAGPQIPPAEMTPLLRAALGSVQIAAPASITVPEQPQSPAQADPGSKEKDDYEQLQKQELFKLLGEINPKLEAADKAFDRPYWSGNTGPGRTTMQPTNPKQESLDILRSAVTIAEKAKYVENKGGLYHLIAYKLSNYAGRVFANKAKQDFFGLAVELVLKADQSIPQNKYMKNKLSEAYSDSAAVWRELTRKALWGNHAYNKAFCDKMVIQQYERALQADPNNSKVGKLLEQLKAPKKPVPEAVKQVPEIDPQKWDQAQTLMSQMEKGSIEPEEPKQEEAHPIQIAEMTLRVGSGSVSIKRSGTDEWKKITEDYSLIYPGDAIKTSADATGVSVSFASDRAFLAIKPDAEVVFQDESTLLIYRAGVHVRVSKRGSEFLVITQTAAVGVRGTSFEVNVGSDNTTETYLYEGVVETRTGSDIGYLVPGQKMIARKGEPKLEQAPFDAQARLKSHWSQLENQRRLHQKALAGGLRDSAVARKEVGRSAQPNHSAGTLAGQAKKGGRETGVSFSWSPYGTYSSVMVGHEFKYGTHNLIARVPAKVGKKTPVTINWYLGNQKISSGNHFILPQAEYFDGQIVTGGEPINPGKYRVEFITRNKKTFEGDVEIEAPGRLEKKPATQKYAASLKIMQEALDLVDKGDLFKAGIKASTVLNDLRQVLYSAPDLPDIQSVAEMCLALMSFTEMMHATENKMQEPANEWVKRSLGHARRSNQLCKDPQFKVSTSRILKALEDVFPGQ